MIHLVADTSPGPLKRFMEERGITRWAYLGSSHAALRGLEQAFDGPAERLPVQEEAQKHEWRLRDEYVRWTDALYLGRRDGLATRVSLLADKNTSNSDLFYSLLLMHTLAGMLQEATGSVLVCCDNAFQARSLARTLRRQGVSGVRCPGALRGSLRAYARSLAVALRDLAAEFRRLGRLAATCRKHQRPDLPEEAVLLLTALDKSSFGQDGVLRDRTFPGLLDLLREEGRSPLLFPLILASGGAYEDAVQWLDQNVPETFQPLRHLRRPDLFRALGVYLAQGFMALPPARFLDMDTRPMTRFLRLDQLRQTYKLLLLAYPAALRDLARTTRVRRAIIRYENSPVCKAVTHGIRKACPQAVVIGYQHAAIAPFMLKYTCSEHEYAHRFQPDFILSNGPWFTERLLLDGFPRDRVRTGPTMRSPFLFSNFRYQDGQRPVPRILVPMPLDLNVARELLDLITRAFAEPGYEVVAKLHPFLPLEELSKHMDLPGPDSGLRFEEGDIFDFLRRCDAVTGLASAVLMETAALEIPVFPIRRRVGVDLNTLTWFADVSEHSSPARDARELRESLDRFFRLDAEDRAALTGELARTVRNCYSPPEVGYRTFLQAAPGDQDQTPGAPTPEVRT